MNRRSVSIPAALIAGLLLLPAALHTAIASNSPLPADGSVLPFPPVPSSSQADVTIESSTYKKRVAPKRLSEDAPKVLVILKVDVGPGTFSANVGEIQTPNLDHIARSGIS